MDCTDAVFALVLALVVLAPLAAVGIARLILAARRWFMAGAAVHSPTVQDDTLGAWGRGWG